MLFPVHFVCHPHDYDDQHDEKDEQKDHIEHAPDLAVTNGESVPGFDFAAKTGRGQVPGYARADCLGMLPVVQERHNTVGPIGSIEFLPGPLVMPMNFFVQLVHNVPEVPPEVLHLGVQIGPDGHWEELSPERRLRNVRHAINEFESTLFLDPDYHEAKLFLAVCLSDPAVGESQLSRDLLREVLSNSTEDILKFIAAKALDIDDIDEAVEFSPAFAKKYFTPDYWARKYEVRFNEMVGRLGKHADWWDQDPGKVHEMLEAANRSITAHCENVKWRSETKDHYWVESAMYSACGAFERIARAVSKNEIVDNYFRELVSTLRQKSPRLVPNLIAHCNHLSEPVLREEFLKTLKRVGAGDTTPIVPKIFYRDLYQHLAWGARSEDREYQETGLRIVKILEKRGPLQTEGKLHLACCYKGLGETEKALDLLEQVDGADSPDMKQAFLENSCETFEQIRVGRLIKRPASGPRQPKVRPLHSMPPVLEVPEDRMIQAIAQDGGSLWLCANRRQNLKAPSGIYDPVIYRYRIATGERTTLKPPVKIKGMATSIAARNNTIWVGTDEGLLEIEPDRNVFRHYQEDDGLLKPNVNSLTLLNDRLYIGLGSGAGYLDINTRRFIGMVTTNDVVRIAASSKAIWVITKGNGLICYPNNSDEKVFQSTWNYADAFSMAANQRYVAIGTNRHAGRFLGSPGGGFGGLRGYDIKRGRSLYGSAKLASIGDVLSLAFAGDLLWIGGRGFIGVFDFPGHDIYIENHAKGDAYALLADNHNGMWVSQDHKLYHLGYGSNRFFPK